MAPKAVLPPDCCGFGTQALRGCANYRDLVWIRHSREGGNPSPDIALHPDFNPMVYMLASHRNGTLYVGVTSSLMQRIKQHREGLIEGFTKDYGIHRLVWFEQHSTMEHAITREKQLKKWNRSWKIRLLEEANPNWDDLAVALGFDPLPSRRIA